MDFDISFVHPAFPAESISPNILVSEGLEQYPGFQGTGFFCVKNNSLFYLTARHCLTKDNSVDISNLAKCLRIPFSPSTDLDRSTVPFDCAYSVIHNSEDLPGVYLDAVAFRVANCISAEKRELLMKRAVKLPPSGEWFRKFLNSGQAKACFESGAGIKLTGAGFPLDDEFTVAEYPEGDNELAAMRATPVGFKGEVGPGAYDDRVKLNNVTWSGTTNGLSGSPVFIGFAKNNEPSYALVGMFVTAGGGMGQMMTVDFLLKLFEAK